MLFPSFLPSLFLNHVYTMSTHCKTRLPEEVVEGATVVRAVFNSVFGALLPPRLEPTELAQSNRTGMVEDSRVTTLPLDFTVETCRTSDHCALFDLGKWRSEERLVADGICDQAGVVRTLSRPELCRFSVDL